MSITKGTTIRGNSLCVLSEGERESETCEKLSDRGPHLLDATIAPMYVLGAAQPSAKMITMTATSYAPSTLNGAGYH